MSDHEQGSQAWLMARVGKLTGCRIADATRLSKNGKDRLKSVGDVMVDLITERLTGQPLDHIITKDMQWGTDTEPEARDAYAFVRGVSVQRVGFVPHPTIQMAGCSPDGLVGDVGMIEIKCPKTR